MSSTSSERFQGFRWFRLRGLVVYGLGLKRFVVRGSSEKTPQRVAELIVRFWKP